jgi:hypothetical protein
MAEAILFVFNLILVVVLCKNTIAVDKTDDENNLGIFSFLTRKNREN